MSKNKSQSTDTSCVDMAYLVCCAVHGEKPSEEKLAKMNLEKVYACSKNHGLSALCYCAVEGVDIPEPLYLKWQKDLHLFARNSILFKAERERVERFCEENGIWYMALKGSVIEKLYPKIGTRQMADIDILFNPDYREQVREYFVKNGYTVKSYGVGNHDVYTKPPVLNFEMHIGLCDDEVKTKSNDGYFNDTFSRLVKDGERNFGYRFKNEDFYIFLVYHIYKHFVYAGTGLRGLLDCWLFSEKNSLNREYAENELKKIGIYDFEQNIKRISNVLFCSPDSIYENINSLCEYDRQFLDCFFNSGIYGTQEQQIKNMVRDEFNKKATVRARLSMIIRYAFPSREIMNIWCEKYAPFFVKHKSLMWLAYIWRLVYNTATKFTSLTRLIKNIWRA